MEAETDLEVGARVAAVRMEVNGVRHHRGARPEQAARILVEEVGFAADLVHRPAGVRGGAARAGARLPALQHARAPDHVVHDEAAADRVAPAVFPVPALRHVVHLADLDGLHVAVLGEARGHALDVPPPIGRVPLHQHLGELDDQVRLARGPHDVVVELQRGRQIRRVALGGAGPPPGVEHCDLPLVERHVVLEVLDADVLLHVPRGHGAGPVPDLGPAGNHARVGLDILIRDERHRGDAVVAVAAHAGPLQDRRDVTAEGHTVRLDARRSRGGVARRRDWPAVLRRHSAGGEQHEDGQDGRSPDERQDPRGVRHHIAPCGRARSPKGTQRAKPRSNAAPSSALTTAS